MVQVHCIIALGLKIFLFCLSFDLRATSSGLRAAWTAERPISVTVTAQLISFDISDHHETFVSENTGAERKNTNWKIRSAAVFRFLGDPPLGQATI